MVTTLLKKYTFSVLLVIGISLLYILPRIIGLKALPPFIDEFIYVHWAQMGFFDVSKRLDSIMDGKQPLFIWLITIAMQWISNPLIAGKAISLFAGFGSMIGLGTAAYLLFKQYKVALLAMILYTLFPFAIIHDRIAIYDSFVTFFYIWTIVLTIIFVRKPTLGKAFLFANVMGAALLTKSTTNMFFFLIPTFFVLSQPPKHYKQTFLPVFLYSIFIVVLSTVYQSVIYLSPESAFISTRNSEFVRPFSDMINAQGLLLSFSNVATVISWMVSYTTIPIFIAACIPFFVKKLRNYQIIFLLTSVVIPFIIFCFIGRNIFPRHVFFFTTPVLILAAYASMWIIEKVKNNLHKGIVIFFLFSGLFFVDFGILHNFPTAPIPAIDRFQFANGWPAGYGVREIIKYLQQQEQVQQIVIANEGAFGSFPKTASELYFSHSPNVHLIDFDEKVTNTIPSQIIEAGKTYPVYIFFNRTQTMPNWPMEKIIEVRKGVGTDYMRLYKYTQPQKTQ